MYSDDHGPPHFHAYYAEYEAQVVFDTLEVLRGRLPNRQMGLVREWAAMHKNELADDWEIGQSPTGNMKRIEPLP
jgi:hypothetical protein